MATEKELLKQLTDAKEAERADVAARRKLAERIAAKAPAGSDTARQYAHLASDLARILADIEEEQTVLAAVDAELPAEPAAEPTR